jgi:hypothetical protein
MTTVDTARALIDQHIAPGAPRSIKSQEVAEILHTICYAVDERALPSFGQTTLYANKTALDADLAHGLGASAWVYADATAANNGIYRKSGASGTGSWVRVLDLPFGVIPITDLAGTDTLTGSSPWPLPSGDRRALISLVPLNTSTGPVTLEVGGADPFDVVDGAGNPLANGALVAGRPVMGMMVSGDLRLIGESDLAASVAAAAASAAAAAASAALVDLGALDDAAAATAADAIATAADLVETAADVVAAEAAKAGAETARDAAFANASVYSDIATGRATVANGAQFMVVDGSEIVRYQRVDASTQTEVARYPASAAVYGAVVHRWGASREADRSYNDNRLRPAQKSDPTLMKGAGGAILTTTADAGGNKINTDGTLTIGASSWIEWASKDKTDYDPGGYYYLYIVGKSPDVVDNLTVAIQQNSVSTIAVDFAYDRSERGVLKIVFRNRKNSDSLPVNSFWPRITNTSGGAIEIFRPSWTFEDNTNIPYDMMRRLKEEAPLSQPEIRSFEFWRDPGFFQLDSEQWLRATTIAVDSVNGNNANAGTRYAPKQTLASIGSAGSMANGTVVALRRGSIWREQLQAFYGADAWDCAFVADDRGNKGGMPIISSWLPIADGNITDNMDGTYSFTFTANATSQPALDSGGNNGYHRVLVRERNVARDAAGNTISGGTVLRWVATIGELATAAGRAYAAYSAGTWTVTFRPRTGVTPLDGSNTYEVTAQRACITQASGNTTGKNASFVGAHFDGAADGYGMLSSGVGSLIDFCALTDGDTHHAVMASMKIMRSLISSNGDVSDSITVAYSTGVNTEDTVNVFDRCFLFTTGGPYAHNNVDETKRAKALIVERNYLIGRRDAITNAIEAQVGVADQTDMIIRRGNYARSVLAEADRSATTFAPMVYSEDNFIDGIVQLQALRGGSRNNIFITTNYGDRTIAGNRGVPGVYARPGGVFENNLVVITHEGGQFVPSDVANYLLDYIGTVINSTQLQNVTVTAQATIRRNIFVIYMPYAAAEGRSTSLFNCSQSSFGNIDLDENIYVVVDPGASCTVVAPAQDLTAPPTFFPATAVGGTADALALTSGDSLSSNPDTITFITGGGANTTAATVAIDGMSAVNLKGSTGSALTAGQLAANTRYTARLVSGEYWLCTFQSHGDGIASFKPKTGYEANGLIIDARKHPLGINSVFRDYANRDLRWASSDIADQIVRFNRQRIKDGKPPCGPNWTVNRNVEQLTVDQAYHLISRRAPLNYP